MLGSTIPFSKVGPQLLIVYLLEGIIQCLYGLKVEVITFIRLPGRAGKVG